MKLNTKSPLFLITFGVVLFTALMNLRSVLTFLQGVFELVFPIALGLLIAFVLNVPMRGFERLLTRLSEKAKKKPAAHTVQACSLFLTLLCIILIIFLAFTMAIPALVNSVKSIVPLAETKWPEWQAALRSYNIDVTMLTEWVNGWDFEQLTGNVGNLLGTAVDAATSTISVVGRFMFGSIIAIYILLSKETLTRQVKKVIYANLRKETADRIFRVSVLARDTYTKFLSGQCVEAIILGTLMFIAFAVFRLPYAGLVGFLTGIFAFVPYIGAAISCVIGVFLALLVNPAKALLGLIVYLVVQFIENQFIYPHVVGGSVGLAPIWTLMAALLGGKMFGVVGIIFFIPLTATLYILVRDNTNNKLKKKELLKPDAGQ